MAAASAGCSEGVSSHREGQRPQRLQEASQDENQRPGALHKDRYLIDAHRIHLWILHDRRFSLLSEMSFRATTHGLIYC